MVSAGWTKPRKVMANTAGGMLPTHRNKPRHSPMAPGSAQVCRGGSVPGAAWGNNTHHRSTCDLLLLTPGQFAWPETKFTGQTPCAVPSGKPIPSVAGSTSVCAPTCGCVTSSRGICPGSLWYEYVPMSVPLRVGGVCCASSMGMRIGGGTRQWQELALSGEAHGWRHHGQGYAS